jgi:hypothetical protein
MRSKDDLKLSMWRRLRIRALRVCGEGRRAGRFVIVRSFVLCRDNIVIIVVIMILVTPFSCALSRRSRPHSPSQPHGSI